MRRVLASLLIVLSPALLCAQTKVRLEFPAEGQREVWIAPRWPKSQPESATMQAAAFDLPVANARLSESVFVWDKATNNLASIQIKAIRGVWKVVPSDFKWVGKVMVSVADKSGEPISAAQVTIRTRGYLVEELLGPSAKGMVAAWGVPPGQIEITVKYKSLSGATKKVVQSHPLKLDRDDPEPVFAVTVLDAVDAGPSPTAAATDVAAKPKEDGGSLVGTLIAVVLGLGVAVGAMFLVMHLLKSNKDVVQQKLQSLGVQMPQEPDDDADDASVPAAPIAPQPQQQILLDDAAPLPPSGIVDPYVPIAAIPTSPRLVGENGKTFELEEGLFTVGREDRLPISLAGESTVSRQHAEIVRSGGEVTLTDLGSTNGTFVNGQKVEAEVVLRPGDAVQFGAVRFRYEA